MGRAVQAAEIFIRRGRGFSAWKISSFEKPENALGKTPGLVSFLDRRQSQFMRLRYPLAPLAFQNFMTCHAIEEQRVAQYPWMNISSLPCRTIRQIILFKGFFK